MSTVVSFRVNERQEDVILKAMIEHGDKKMNAHIKRIYFEQIEGKVNKKETQIEDIYLFMRYLKEKESATNEDDLIMKLLAGIYIMLRNSVTEKTKKEADKLLDIKAIEEFIQKND